MSDFLLAIQSDAFARNSEDLIRKKFPVQVIFSLKLPVPGKGSTDVTVTLHTKPYRISADIQGDGKIYVHAEIEVYLASISHSLIINEVFPEGQTIPGTQVVMTAAPPMPLTHDFSPPVLLGVPAIDVRISRTTQNMLEGKRIQLNAEIDPGQIYVTLNLPGLLQVLVQKLSDAIVNGINGTFGHSNLGKILAAVINFADLLLQNVLQILKLPDKLLSAMESSLASAVQGQLTKLWTAREVPLFVVPRTIVIAPAVEGPGSQKAAVEVLISSLSAGANIVAHPPVKEFLASMDFASV